MKLGETMSLFEASFRAYGNRGRGRSALDSAASCYLRHFLGETSSPKQFKHVVMHLKQIFTTNLGSVEFMHLQVQLSDWIATQPGYVS